MKTLAFFGVVLAVDLLAVVFQSYCPPLAVFRGAGVMVFPVILACTVVILAAQYLMITFRLGGLIFPKTLWVRIFLPGFFAMLISVPVYFAFYFLADALDYTVKVEADDRDKRRR